MFSFLRLELTNESFTGPLPRNISSLNYETKIENIVVKSVRKYFVLQNYFFNKQF